VFASGAIILFFSLRGLLESGKHTRTHTVEWSFRAAGGSGGFQLQRCWTTWTFLKYCRRPLN